MGRRKISKREASSFLEMQILSEEDRELLDGYAQSTTTDTFFDRIKRWTLTSSLQCFPFVNGCCQHEFKSACSSKYQLETLCSGITNQTPRQSDLLIIGGSISKKQLIVLKEIYDQMPSPKWVMVIGSCAISGGLYNSYSTISGVAGHIPVDVYVPGCPPVPEAIIQGVLQLKEKIRRTRKSQILEEVQ